MGTGPWGDVCVGVAGRQGHFPLQSNVVLLNKIKKLNLIVF